MISCRAGNHALKYLHVLEMEFLGVPTLGPHHCESPIAEAKPSGPNILKSVVLS